MNYYFEAFKKYADFSGRAMRIEYWTFYLVNFFISMAISIMIALVGDKSALGVLTALYWFWILLIIVPGLAVSVRRLHDTNHSGWWFLISFVPVVGFIVMLVFTLSDSQAGTNQYGPNPKEPAKPVTA